MEKLKTRTVKKVIETWSVLEGYDIEMRVTKENSRIKECVLLGKGPHKSRPVFVKPEFLDFIKENNPWGEYNSKGKYIGYGWKGRDIDPKEIYKGNVEVTRENLVYAYSDGHILFDADGDPIPLPKTYNYIGTPFSNQYCDLEPMLEHLKSHPWVIDGGDLEIQKVPYYNNEGGWKKFIGNESQGLIRILPTKEAYKEIYDRYKDEEFFSTKMKEAIHSGVPYEWMKPEKDLPKDYLGIRQFYKPREEDD